MVRPYEPFPPPSRPDWGKVIEEVMTDVTTVASPGDVVYLKDGQPIGIAVSVDCTHAAGRTIETRTVIEQKEFHARRLGDRVRDLGCCVECGTRIKIGEIWCERHGPGTYKNFALCEAKVHAELIAEDRRMMWECGWILFAVVAVGVWTCLLYMGLYSG